MVYGRRSTAVKVERDYEVEALGIISLVEEPESAKARVKRGFRFYLTLLSIRLRTRQH